MEFKKEILTDNRIYVHCDTIQKAHNLLEWAHKNGKRWSTGSSYVHYSTGYTDDRWGMYEENTMYCVADGTFEEFGLSDESCIELKYEDVIINNSNKETKMSVNVKKLKEQNLDAAKTAAMLKAGETALTVVKKQFGKKIPAAYIDSPLADIAIANLVKLMIDSFIQNPDEKIGKLSEALTTAAYSNVLNKFDVTKFVNDLTKKAGIDSLLSE